MRTELGRLLVAIRKEKKLTQESAAIQMGMERKRLSLIENGNNLPKLQTLIRLADFYEIDIIVLIDTFKIDMEERERREGK